MLFLNLSSDKVQISDGIQEVFLERNGIENVLGPTLVEWYRIRPWNQTFVLNGPGGFTNLRVGTLALNLLSSLIGGSLPFFTCTKIDFYAYLVQHGFLPSRGLIYLGQKRNVWNYDFGANSYQLVRNDGGWSAPLGDFFVDCVIDDTYWETELAHMVNIGVKGDSLEVMWHGKSFAVRPKDLGLLPDVQVKPEYLIDVV